MADSLPEVASQPTYGGKLKSAAWWTAKKALLITPTLAAFALVAAPPAATAALTAAAPVGLGADIASGKIGIFGAGFETLKYGVTEVVPYAWGSVPEVLTALKTSTIAGSSELSQYLAPTPDI